MIERSRDRFLPYFNLHESLLGETNVLSELVLHAFMMVNPRLWLKVNEIVFVNVRL